MGRTLQGMMYAMKSIVQLITTRNGFGPVTVRFWTRATQTPSGASTQALICF
jgi:hypothetical protein